MKTAHLHRQTTESELNVFSVDANTKLETFQRSLKKKKKPGLVEVKSLKLEDKIIPNSQKSENKWAFLVRMKCWH